jgi:hypothetical protein
MVKCILDELKSSLTSLIMNRIQKKLNVLFL